LNLLDAIFLIPLTDSATLKKWECLDSDTGEDLTEEVRKYHIPDFSNWKHHDAFERAFRPAGKRFAHEHRQVGRVTPCAPSRQTRTHSLAIGGGQRTARPTFPQRR